jgi:8-oxo-dGTP diphosphatase
MVKENGKTVYVAGFAFDEPGDHVLLVEKRRPAWQAGKLNGIGGKVEPGELPVEAMAREFEEETGVATTEGEWREFAVVTTDKSRVHMFAVRLPRGRVETAKTTTDERIRVVLTGELHEWTTLPNLAWLVPMALRADDILEPAQVRERARYES